MTKAPRGATRVVSLLAAFVATSVVGGVLLAGLGMPAVGATGVAARGSVNFFESLPSDLKQPPLSEKSSLRASDGTPIADFFDQDRINVPLDQIAPVMHQAIVAIEDSRFYQHGGVDPKGLTRAAAANFANGGVVQGASTLTQQYVKNVLIESAAARGDDDAVKAAREQTKKRKLLEIRLAISLEKQTSKQEILNRYLNISSFGDRVYGVESASRYFFRKNAKNLTLPEAALLAGIVQRPDSLSPIRHPEAAKTRRDIVLKRMLGLSMIDQKSHDAAVATPIKTTITKPPEGCANAKDYYGFYCDYIQRLIVNNDGFSSLGKTEEEREKTLLRGGLTITTTLDTKIQKAAWDALNSTIPATDKSGVATAAVTVEPGTGKVLAVNQNRVYNPAGKRGQTATNFATDFEYGGSGGFQTGSTFKPFTLATWLKRGKSLNAVVSAQSGPAPFSDFKACGKRLRGQSYPYSNAEGDGSAPMTVMEASYRSVNTAYVSMEKQLDLCDIKETAQDLGVHLASEQRDECYNLKEGEEEKDRPRTRELPECVPSLTLGPKELSPMTMAAAFATFAAGGMYCTPVAVVSIKDRDGKALPVPKEKCKRALDKDVAAGVTHALQKVLTQGTAQHVGGIGRPAAGKTGTTNGSVDTWFVGYSAQRSTAVWVGDPIPKKKNANSSEMVRKTLNGRTIDGQRRGTVYGGTFAAPIWKKIMTKAHDDLPKRGFSSPPAKLLEQDKTGVPNVEGQPVDQALRTLRQAGFDPRVTGRAPSRFAEGTVAAISPSGGSQAARGTSISVIVSSGGGDGQGEDLDDLFPGFRR